MPTIKRRGYVFIAIAAALTTLQSCTTSSNNTLTAPPQTVFKQPDVQPLKFGKAKKIDWAAIKAEPVIPVVQKFDLDKLPAVPYDSAGFKPFSETDEVAKFDYNATPEKDFDIDKLPSNPLTFKTFILPPPKLIKAGLPHLKNAGDLSIYQFGEAQGIQGTFASCLLTDHDGFLWIGTDRGLYRYDGETLLRYKIFAVQNNVIMSMVQDKMGRMWISSNLEKLTVLDPRKGTLKKLRGAKGFIGSTWKLLLDKQQRIWVSNAYPGGISIIDADKQTIKWLDKAHGLSDTVTNGLILDHNNKIWIATKSKIDVIDLEKKKIKYLDIQNCSKLDSTAEMFCDKAGRVWLGMKHGVAGVLNAGQNSLQTIKEAESPKNNIYNFSEDDEGKVWITTKLAGVEAIDLKNKTALNLKKANGLEDDFIISTASDGKGQTWLGTQRGINIIGDNHITKQHIGKTLTGTLFEDGRGLIWQASYVSDMDILDLKNKTARHIGKKEGLDNDSIQNIKQINDKIYVGTNGGLEIIDSVKHTITHLTYKQGLHNKSVTNIAADNIGRIWLAGFQNGLDIYDPKANTIRHISKKEGLTDTYIADMNKDKQGNIWISTESGGIEYIDLVSGVIHDVVNVKELKEKTTKLLMPDDKGNMWVGTQKGIFIADIKNHMLTHFGVQQGLINESVTSLLPHDHRIYASTLNGVTVLTPPRAGTPGDKKWEVESFGSSYGLAKINTGTYLTDMITRDGLYWWGDVGITVLNLVKDTAQTVSYVSGIRVMDRQELFVDRSQLEAKGTDTLWGQGDTHYLSGQTPVNTGYALQSGLAWDKVSGPYNMPVNLQLPYNQNFIQFEYSALNLNKRDTTWYKYYLSGADEKWSEETSAPFSRNYYNLKKGNYTFEVSAKNPNGSWSNPAQISFTINPPWWLNWWAYIIDACLLGAVIYGFVYYRSIQLVKEKRILEHKVHVRTEEVLQQKEEIEAQRDSLEKTIGELKVTQSQLVQSEKLASLGELTAGIAHEIQNPLNFVNNFAEVSVELIAELREEQKKDIREPEAENEILDSLEQNLQKITLHGKRADGIVKNMLQHSRNNSGERQLTNVNTLADEYFRLSYHGLRAKDKSFNSAMETHLDSQLKPVSIVPQDIGRVLLNLFNNAFYAVHQKKKQNIPGFQPMVTLTTLTKKGFVEIRVKDNGNGIPENIKEKIMQPFFTTKPTGEGTGLGLSLSYDIVVKGHGGKIDINTREGEFTEFIVLLPTNADKN